MAPVRPRPKSSASSSQYAEVAMAQVLAFIKKMARAVRSCLAEPLLRLLRMEQWAAPSCLQQSVAAKQRMAHDAQEAHEAGSQVRLASWSPVCSQLAAPERGRDIRCEAAGGEAVP